MFKLKKIKDAVAFLRDAGLIFEINRKILHPLGLALEIKINDDGSEEFGELWDCRDDPEGIIYNEECFKYGLKKLLQYMQDGGRDVLKRRVETLGYLVQKPKKEIQ